MLIPAVLYLIVVSSMTLLCLTTDLLILFLTNNKELQRLTLCRARLLLLILQITFSLQPIEGTNNIIINEVLFE